LTDLAGLGLNSGCNNNKPEMMAIAKSAKLVGCNKKFTIKIPVVNGMFAVKCARFSILPKHDAHIIK
jgi:hypothetical protein